MAEYDSLITIEKIGTTPYSIRALRDLDATLDQLVKEAEKKHPALTPDQIRIQNEELLRFCPYFGVIWPAARGLARFIEDRKSSFSKRKGIELGAGLALPSIAAARASAEMLVTDFHPDVETFALENAQLNHVRLHYQLLDWSQPLPAELQQAFDFVLAADVLYESAHPTELAQTLKKLIHPQGVIYLSDPGRVYLDRMLDAMSGEGFEAASTIYEVDESGPRPELKLEKKRKVTVFEFTLSSP